MPAIWRRVGHSGQSAQQQRRQCVGQSILEKREKHGNQGGEQTSEGRGHAHRSHGQGAIENHQRERAPKPAQNYIEQVERAGHGQVHDEAERHQQNQEENVAGRDDQQGGSTASAHAADKSPKPAALPEEVTF